MVVSEELSGTNEIYFDIVISHIKAQGVTILVVMLDAEQDSILVTHALEKGLLYPQYTWIHVEIKPEWLVNEELHDPATIFRRWQDTPSILGIQGHIFLVPLTTKKKLFLEDFIFCSKSTAISRVYSLSML